jgi:hypothetical protein
LLRVFGQRRLEDGMAMGEGDAEQPGARTDSTEDGADSQRVIDPPTASKFKIPLNQQRPPRSLPPEERTKLPRAAPPAPRGPSRMALVLFGIVVAVVTGFAMWTTLRDAKRSEPVTTAQSSAVATSTASTTSSPSETVVTAACRCLNDRSQGPALRAQCVRQLVDSPALDSTTCLQAFLEDPRTQEAMNHLGPDKLTPEEDLIIDAANAMPAKYAQAKAQGANIGPRPKPPPAAVPDGSVLMKKQ